MKTLKLFLAWIDWSTYAKTSDEKSWKSDYEFPKSLCRLAWRTLFSLIALPFTWITHIWNRILVPMDTFRSEESELYKLNVWTTILYTVIFFIMGIGAHDKIDTGWGWDWFHMSDPLLLNYLKLLGCGILSVVCVLIALAIIIGISYIVYRGVMETKRMVTKKTFDIKSGEYTETAAAKTIHAIKNKYCPTIDWSSVKKNK